MAMQVRRSAARMADLIEDVMDFARGRLSGGLTLRRKVTPDLDVTLEHVVMEMRARTPGRVITSDIVVDGGVSVDPVRISQLLSNLVANALSHGRPGSPVTVRARNAEDGFEIAVANQGEPIPPQEIGHLFQPFTRGAASTDSSGLGLGLYIASEIAKAHGGTLAVDSTSKGTRFNFKMPTVPETKGAFLG
jgi:signal transduction histidine kinase